MKNIKVVIGIPTFKRPEGLTLLLESIADQVVDFELVVLVADNDGVNGFGVNVVKLLNLSGYPFVLLGISVIERGISQVRNALMNEAFDNLQADFIAMVDDDEWVEPQWISALINTHYQTNADIVGGNVIPDFEIPPPDWLKELDIYYQRDEGVSRIVPFISGTTNVLLSRSLRVKNPTELFDTFYSLVGGGDYEYFTRLKNKGMVFAYSKEAKSHEIFGASRLTKEWAIERAYRIGAGNIRILLKNKPGLIKIILEVLKSLMAIALSLLYMIFKFRVAHKKMKARLLLSRQLGKISAVFGKQSKVYENVHGK